MVWAPMCVSSTHHQEQRPFQVGAHQYLWNKWTPSFPSKPAPLCPHLCLSSCEDGNSAWNGSLWKMLPPEGSCILRGNRRRPYLVRPSLPPSLGFRRCRAPLSGQLGRWDRPAPEGLKEEGDFSQAWTLSQTLVCM